jgi:cell division protein FtsN
MAPYERGSDDDVRVFDGGEDEAETEGSSLPVVIVICLLVLTAFGGVVWLAYNYGVAHGRGDVTSHPATQTASTQAPATEPGSGAPIKIYQQPAGPDEIADQGTATSPPAQLTKVAPAPAKPAPVPSEKMRTAQKPIVEKPVPPVKKPVTVAKAVPPKPEALVASQTATVAGGAFVLQIGAYKTETDAETAWKDYASKHADVLAGASHEVQKADLGDKGVWYRLRAGSFADKETAGALCDKLKAEGGVCFPAK